MFQMARRPEGQMIIRADEGGYALHDSHGMLEFVEQDQRAACVVGTEDFAKAIIAEWPAKKPSDPLAQKPDRPASQIAKLALLSVPYQRTAFIENIMRFTDSDTIGYWQKYPQNLLQHQQTHWQPIWDWCAEHFGAVPEIEYGLAKLAMPVTTKRTIRAYLEKLSDFSLASMFFLCPISGSIVLALAQHAEHVSAQEAYGLANLEVLFQQEHWGEDDELSARLLRQEQAFVLAGLGFHA